VPVDWQSLIAKIETLSAVEAARASAQGSPHGGGIVMTEHPRITLAAEVLTGKPVIRGTRLSVEFIIGLLADGWPEREILADYPGIEHEDIIACLAYARDMLSSEKVFPSAA
jgi:uncharacterized protein (DUF433 family)